MCFLGRCFLLVKTVETVCQISWWLGEGGLSFGSAQGGMKVVDPATLLLFCVGHQG